MDSESSFALSSLLCPESEACFDLDEDKMFINIISETEDEYIEMLIDRECILGSNGSSDCMIINDEWFKCARLDAIAWILRTRAFFGFGLQTAYLAFTYFDQFLSKRAIDNGKTWAVQLLSVACLSLAAKMEECSVPSLMEFCTEEYNFECKVIQRMELLVLSTLEWRMGSITPFAYLNYFITKLSNEYRPKDLVSGAAELIIAITKEINLMYHRPSAIAMAAVLAALDQKLTRKTMEFKMNVMHSRGSLEFEHVFSCYNLMREIEMEKIKIPRFMISPDLSSIYSRSTDVLEDYSLYSDTRTKRRRLTFSDCDSNLTHSMRRDSFKKGPSSNAL